MTRLYRAKLQNKAGQEATKAIVAESLEEALALFIMYNKATDYEIVAIGID